MLSCPRLFCDLMKCSPPGSSVHELFQARILEWVAISYSRGLSQLRDQTRIFCVSCIGRWILDCGANWEAHSFRLIGCKFLCTTSDLQCLGIRVHLHCSFLMIQLFISLINSCQSVFVFFSLINIDCKLHTRLLLEAGMNNRICPQRTSGLVCRYLSIFCIYLPSSFISFPIQCSHIYYMNHTIFFFLIVCVCFMETFFKDLGTTSIK